MGKPSRVAIDPVADLLRRLHRAPAARLAPCVRRWWRDHGFGGHPAAVGKRIALALIEQRRADGKRAGMVILGELLADQLRSGDLPAFAHLFDAGHLADTALVDRFGHRVLVPLLARDAGRAEAAVALARWRDAETTAQRRAACLGLAPLAARGDAALPGLTDLVFTMCRTIVWSHQPDDQTAVGALLCALSSAEPVRVETFVRRHARLMSRACARAAVAKLPSRAALLAHHKRATTIR